MDITRNAIIGLAIFVSLFGLGCGESIDFEHEEKVEIIVLKKRLCAMNSASERRRFCAYYRRQIGGESNHTLITCYKLERTASDASMGHSGVYISIDTYYWIDGGRYRHVPGEVLACKGGKPTASPFW